MKQLNFIKMALFGLTAVLCISGQQASSATDQEVAMSKCSRDETTQANYNQNGGANYNEYVAPGECGDQCDKCNDKCKTKCSKSRCNSKCNSKCDQTSSSNEVKETLKSDVQQEIEGL